ISWRLLIIKRVQLSCRGIPLSDDNASAVPEASKFPEPTRYAGVWIRLAAFLLDWLLALAVLAGVAYVLFLLGVPHWPGGQVARVALYGFLFIYEIAYFAAWQA